MNKTEQRTYDSAQPLAKALGYDVYWVQYVKEGAYWYLRVFIDREEGVNVDDCEIISKQLSPILDEEDYIGENYFLEVSSPGIERELFCDRHMNGAIGSKVRVNLFKGKADGILMSFDNDSITLSEPEKTIDRKKVKSVRLKPDIIF